GGDVGADFFDDADVLVTHRCGSVDGFDAAVGPQVRAAHAGRGDLDDGVGRVLDARVVAGIETDIAGGVEDCSSHGRSPWLPFGGADGGRSAGGVAAVDGQRDADDEAGAGAAQPEHGGGHLLRAAETPDGLVGGGLGAVEVAGVDHLGHHRGLDGAGADGVDADTAGGVFQGSAASQPDDAMFGRVIGGPAGQPDQPSE